MDSLNIVFAGPNNVVVQHEPVPEVGPHEILVHANRSLISTGTECIILGHAFEPNTHWDRWVRYPMHPGYSLVGDVVAVGSEVSCFLGRERVCLRHNHRQYTVANAADATVIPDAISDEDATWYGLANIAQIGVRQAEPVLGQTVAVIGLGILGQLVCQYSRLFGAREVIAVDTASARLELARSHGATIDLQVSAEAAADEVMQVTNGKGADVVFEVTGNAEVLPAALRLARRFGTVMLLGDTGYPSRQHLTGDLVTRGLRIVGAHDTLPPAASSDHARWSHREMTDLFFRYLEWRDMRVGDMVTHRFSPVDAPKAFDLLQHHRDDAMGVIFDWSQV